jgi:para-nitrobenzyl esterase
VDPREIWSAIETDRMFRIGSIRAAQSQAGQAPTYMYLFNWESPAMGGALGSCHALEIPFVFGTLDKPNVDRFAGTGPDAERLSGQMMDAWLAFARRGDPNTASIPNWPTYDATSRSTMTFGRDTSVTDTPGDGERRLWEDAGQSVG